jgi:LytR cell envelope-related transcriptional attenuator
VTSAAMRAAILAGAVIVGAIVIANAFPTEGSTGPLAGTSPSSAPSSNPSSHPSPPAHKLDCSGAPNAQLAVENAHTETNGLAAATAIKLQAAGYRINAADIKNAPADSETTTVFFRTTADKDAARCLRKKFFHGADLAKLPADAGVSSAVQVAVYVGADYAAAHPVH